MTPRSPLTDSQRELQAIVEEAVGNAANKTPTVQAPSPSESSEELEKGKRLVRWEWCEKEGPVFKLRKDLAEQRERQERGMKKAIMLATFFLALVSGGIQVWGKLTARAEANAEMVQTLKDLRREIAASSQAAQVGAKTP